MTMLRPNCAVCHALPREPGSARCADCGVGRIQPAPRHRYRSLERAARALGDADHENPNRNTNKGENKP